MGIRFICHACNKRLNVKAFLAGKRGICPHCGTKVDIPWQSVSSDNGQDPEASRIVRESVGAGKANGSFPSTGNPTIPVAESAPKYQANVVSKLPSSRAAPVSGQGASPGAQATAGSVPVAKAASSPPPPDQRSSTNPIDEAPDAVWYVRPPSGGQYGPASGEIMKKWVDEGRVSADSLVWRDGWADWMTADSLFAKLGGSQSAAPPAPASAAPAAPFGGAAPMGGVAAENGSARPYVKRRSNNSLAVVMVVLLTLASLGLFGVLIAVIRFIQ